MATKKFLVDIDLAKNSLNNARIQNLSSDPSTPVSGQAYYNTTTNRLRVYDGTSWIEMGSAEDAGVSTVNGRTGAVVLDQTDVDLDNVDNTSDANKPVSTAQQTALDLKADISSLATVATTGSYDDLTDKPTFSADRIEDTEVELIAQDTSSLFGLGVLLQSKTDPATTGVNITAPGDLYISSNAGATGESDFTPGFGLEAGNLQLVSDGRTTVQGPDGLWINNGGSYSSTLKSDNVTVTRTFQFPDANGTLATEAYVDAEVASLVDAAPGTLDTLNELAAALGDDANFATTTATSLGEKLVKTANLSDVTSAATAFGNIKQAATTSATGVVELAVQAEAQAKTDTTRALTAASVADFARKHVSTIGNGSLTALPVTHGLGSQYVTAQVFDATSNELVECDVVLTSATVTTFNFNVAPTTNQYRVVIVG